MFILPLSQNVEVHSLQKSSGFLRVMSSKTTPKEYQSQGLKTHIKKTLVD